MYNHVVATCRLVTLLPYGNHGRDLRTSRQLVCSYRLHSSEHRTYAQLQLADPSFRFMDGIAKNVPVQIKDHYIPTHFLVIDTGEEYDTPIILGRLFLNTTKAIIYIGTRKVHFQFPLEKVCLHSIAII